MKKKLIYGIGIYHIQTKPEPLSVLNIQPFKGRSQVGSDPSHYTAPPPFTWMLSCRFPKHLVDNMNHPHAGTMLEETGSAFICFSKHGNMENCCLQFPRALHGAEEVSVSNRK